MNGDKDNYDTQLSFCTTCKIIRPPRSFHCGTCGVCVEVHDHHCPWMGTCIAKRNTRYFVLFLFYVVLHSLLTCLLCALYGFIFTTKKLGPLIKELETADQSKKKRLGFLVWCHIANIAVGCYGGCMAMTLSVFAAN